MTIKGNEKIKAMGSLQNSIKGGIAGIDPTVMFIIMVAVTETQSFEPFFEYEMTPEPMSRFKD